MEEIASTDYCCDICGERTSSKQNLRRHNRLVHAITLANQATNMDAGGRVQRVRDSQSPDGAARRASGDEEVTSTAQDYECDICGKEMDSTWALRRHNRMVHAITSTSMPLGEELKMEEPDVTVEEAGEMESSSLLQEPSSVAVAAESSQNQNQSTTTTTTTTTVPNNTCEVCGRKCSNQYNLNRHRKSQHPDQESTASEVDKDVSTNQNDACSEVDKDVTSNQNDVDIEDMMMSPEGATRASSRSRRGKNPLKSPDAHAKSKRTPVNSKVSKSTPGSATSSQKSQNSEVSTPRRSKVDPVNCTCDVCGMVFSRTDSVGRHKVKKHGMISPTAISKKSGKSEQRMKKGGRSLTNLPKLDFSSAEDGEQSESAQGMPKRGKSEKSSDEVTPSTDASVGDGGEEQPDLTVPENICPLCHRKFAEKRYAWKHLRNVHGWSQSKVSAYVESRSEGDAPVGQTQGAKSASSPAPRNTRQSRRSNSPPTSAAVSEAASEEYELDCAECGKTFPTTYRLSMHKRYAHGDRDSDVSSTSGSRKRSASDVESVSAEREEESVVKRTKTQTPTVGNVNVQESSGRVSRRLRALHPDQATPDHDAEAPQSGKKTRKQNSGKTANLLQQKAGGKPISGKTADQSDAATGKQNHDDTSGPSDKDSRKRKKTAPIDASPQPDADVPLVVQQALEEGPGGLEDIASLAVKRVCSQSGYALDESLAILGTPLGSPLGNPLGAPLGTPLGAPLGTPLASPLGAQAAAMMGAGLGTSTLLSWTPAGGPTSPRLMSTPLSPYKLGPSPR